MCITLILCRKCTKRKKKNWEKSQYKNIQYYMYVSERGDREDRVLCRKLRRLLPKGISWVFGGKIYDSFISFLFSCTSLLISVHFSVDTINRTYLRYDTRLDGAIHVSWLRYKKYACMNMHYCGMYYADNDVLTAHPFKKYLCMYVYF